MRYGIALLIAGLVIAAIVAFSWQNYNLVERSVRQHLRQLKERGDLPPELQGVDTETVDLRNYNVKVPADVMSRQDIARFLAAFWFVWTWAILGVSIAVAALLGRWYNNAERGAAPDRPHDKV